MFGFGRKKETLRDFIFAELGKSRFNYSQTDSILQTVESYLDEIEKTRRARDLDEVLRRSQLKDRMERSEGMSGSKFDKAISDYKRYKRIY